MTGCGVVTSTVALSFDEEKPPGMRKVDMSEPIKRRVWKPLDVGGKRLYEVVEIWPRTEGRGERKNHSLVVATSPSSAVAELDGRVAWPE